MGLFDIFSTSFLITIGITILALCLMFLYFSQKFSEQDHKLSSMADLVTTMAHEIHTLKFQQQEQQQVETVQYPSDLATNGTSTLVTKKNTQLIEVSDSDDDDDDESVDDDTDDESVDDSASLVSLASLDSASLDSASLVEENNLDDIQDLESVNNDNVDDNVDDNNNNVDDNNDNV